MSLSTVEVNLLNERFVSGTATHNKDTLIPQPQFEARTLTGVSNTVCHEIGICTFVEFCKIDENL